MRIELFALLDKDKDDENVAMKVHEQEAWLAAHGSEIRAKIEQGYAALRGNYGAARRLR